ncbi:hypothetical protein ACH40E_42090 [Streptomyces acidicola]|uniref:hypothetical protein n=1 Tax=Streptomyces acidicola TaxID=2596892 RepID=UPI0037A054C7
MADIGGGGRGSADLGALGDHHVRVAGALGFAMSQAPLHGSPADRVQGHRVGALSEADGAAGRIDVIQPQVADLAAGGAVQQGENAQQCLVRVNGGTAGRPSEEASLLVEGEGLADEALGCLRRQSAGGVDEDHLVALGEAEELPGDLHSRRGRRLG